MESIKEKDIQEQRREERLNYNLSRIKRKIVVMSGKGGVGKTTVAVNISRELSERGYKVGIFDVDIHGPNVAKMLGVEHKKIFADEKGELMKPVPAGNNLFAVSLAFILENRDTPVIWRGPMKAITIKQLLSDVDWGELDYLIVDCPPGTGDEPLSVCQIIKEADGAVIVTTPQDVAVLDSRKTVVFAKTLKLPVVGIIENMSGFKCPHCGESIELFGKGGGETTAIDFNVSFLGRISLDPDIVKCGDSEISFQELMGKADRSGEIKKITDNILNFIDANKKEYKSN